MSGPKTSFYILTKEQQRILAEQRRIAKRKAIGIETIQRARQQFLLIRNTVSSEKSIAIELISKIGNDNGFSELEKKVDHIITSVEAIISQTNYGDLNSIEKTVNKIEITLGQANTLVTEISTKVSENHQLLKLNLYKDISEGFTTSFADIQKEDTANTPHIYQKSITTLKKLKESPVPHPYKNEIDEVYMQIKSITDSTFLQNYIALAVTPLVKKVDSFIKEYNECKKDFDSLYTEYSALCKLYSLSPQDYTCSYTSITELKSEIKHIQDNAAKNDEQAYISECIDEVMSDMGYNILGNREVTKRNGKHFRNALYSYGKETAVNVTYASDGKIVMELGGMDVRDRVPTTDETYQLCASMETFCEDFKKIEEKLVDKGVILSDRISLLPSNAEYAQIINTKDYNMLSDIEAIQIKRKRQSAFKQKAMKRD